MRLADSSIEALITALTAIQKDHPKIRVAHSSICATQHKPVKVMDFYHFQLHDVTLTRANDDHRGDIKPGEQFIRLTFCHEP